MADSNRVTICRVPDYDPARVRAFLDVTLRPAVEAAPTARRILVKPNLLGAFAPEQAVTTHPVVVEQTVRLLQELGREVVLGDSPGGSAPQRQVWQVTGMSAVAERCGVPLLDFLAEPVHTLDVNGVELCLSQAAFSADAIVNLAKYKTHTLMRYTGAVKNLYGLVPGMRKSLYHRDYQRPQDFLRVLLAIYGTVRPRVLYSVLDGVLGMEGEGPSGGKPRAFGVMMGGTCAAALDWTAARMMGFAPHELPYVRAALRVDGLVPEEIDPGEEGRGYRFPDVDTSSVRFRGRLADGAPKMVRQLFRKMFDFFPSFKAECKRCGICVRSCPVGALRLSEQDPRPVLNRSLCIRCMCCHEMCPHHAVEVRKTWLAGLFLRR